MCACLLRPRSPRLLGLNVGKGIEVKLRLRRDGRDLDFIPYEEVLDTMLHELCHNERGPHDAQFYKLWDELRKVRGLLCILMFRLGVLCTSEGIAWLIQLHDNLAPDRMICSCIYIKFPSLNVILVMMP